MKLIPLTRGYSAMVDDADYERLSQHRWRALLSKTEHRLVIYAMRSEPQDGKDRFIFMHHEVLGIRTRTDHEDGNGLNNQRLNLRPATYSENGANRQKTIGTSRWKGVYWNRTYSRWYARITKDGVTRQLGSFRKEHNAAQAYNFAAAELFGSFAKFNFLGGEQC